MIEIDAMVANDVPAVQARLESNATSDNHDVEGIIDRKEYTIHELYYYQIVYRGCGHTINRFNRLDDQMYDIYKAGRVPYISSDGFCADCRARRGINNSNLDSHVTLLRVHINDYVAMLDEFKRDLKHSKNANAQKDAEIQQLRQTISDMKTQGRGIKQEVQDEGPTAAGGLAQLRALTLEQASEIQKHVKKIATQGNEIGELRGKVKDKMAEIQKQQKTNGQNGCRAWRASRRGQR